MDLIDKGPTFELYRGSTGALRLDWTQNGALRCTYAGQVEGSSADLVTSRLNAMLRRGQPITALYDCWEATTLEKEIRSALQEWVKRNPGAIGSVGALSRSKVITMSFTALALALEGVDMKTYAKRADFDVLCKKTGLPTNVSLPMRTAAAAS